MGETQTVTEFTVEGGEYLFFTAIVYVRNNHAHIHPVPISHPREIFVTRVSATSANVSWTPLTLSEARGFITEYNISYWREGDDSANAMIRRVPGNQSSVIIETLDAESNYYFTVSVGTVQGASNVSEAIIIHGTGNQGRYHMST